MDKCNCENLYDQNCKHPIHLEEKRRGREALFDYMACAQMEEQFKDLETLEEWKWDQ